ncbi:C-type lectin 1-like [Ylistrum balloti]|uniref:C-type lectin 1-like n=1 Tax=Ylistrum balloti TaxID=509963 RepID=UPI00290588E1|nr:C-type lectin 1-like [Ylistrum balloti]
MFGSNCFSLVALLYVLLPVKGDNSTDPCVIDDVIMRNLLSMNLTITDQKAEICSLKSRLERIERIHDMASSPEVHDIAIDNSLVLKVLNQIIYSRLMSVADSFNNTIITNKTCKDDWVHFQGQCYYLSDRKMSWDSAHDSCLSMNARLAIMDDEDINIFVRNITPRFRRYWIGGRTEGKTWQWVATGSDFKYTAWCPEQPDGKGVRCLSFFHLVPQICYWTDRKCKFREEYICQRPL